MKRKLCRKTEERRIVVLALLFILVITACSKQEVQEQAKEPVSSLEEEIHVDMKNNEEIVISTYKQYDLDTYMKPFWKGRVVHNETVFFLGDSDKKILLYEPDEIVSVRSYDLKTEYQRGKDYELVDGKLVLMEGTSIPYISEEAYYGVSDSFLITRDSAGRERPTYWGEGDAMTRYQIAVTYTHSQYWNGYEPQCSSEVYQNINQKLKNGEDITIVFYGDSITYGANSSWMIGVEPKAPTWSQLSVLYLAKQYGYRVNYISTGLDGTCNVPENVEFGNNGTIHYINTSVGGWGVSQGINNFHVYVAPYIRKYGCDLFVTAFGMNDGQNSAKSEASYMKYLASKVLNIKKESAILFVSTMVPNPNAVNGWYKNQVYVEEELQVAVKAYQEEGAACAVQCMTSASLSVLEKKDFVDCTGNNINHPNDFLARLYAQTFIETVVGYDNLPQ